ncbi:MAG: ABC transporter permease [Beijerinckiaceae bacterium]
MNTPVELPRWADVALVPLLTVATAFAVSGLVVLAIGENPFQAMAIMFKGALGTKAGWGYTLYYTTSFIFTGLAVAIAFQAGLFNIGGEGQATLGGLGAVLFCFAFEGLPAILLVPLGVLGAALAGALWAFIPGYLQAKRGSHVVITTIMFNFIAATLMVYLLVNVMGRPGSMAPETRNIAAHAVMAPMNVVLGGLGISFPRTPWNLSFVLAILCAVGVWLLIWHTRLGYEIRVVGASAPAAVYAGISPLKITVVSMAISGALAGMLAVNEIMGVQYRLLLEFSAGAGFVGIAVALMGRAHPLGVVLAAFLFGILYQGGTELSFEKPSITRDMIVVIQGFVILFAGALEYGFKRPVARFLASRFFTKAEAKGV